MGIKDDSVLVLHPNKHPRKRSQQNGIILTHMIDLIDVNKCTTSNMKFDVSDVNQFNEHSFYFRRDLGYMHYGYHMLFETYYNNIFNYNGCSLSNRSEYLTDLVKSEILNPQYIDWMLIVINGNLDYDLCEKEMYRKVAYYVAGIMNYEHIKLDNLKYLYNIIDTEKAKKSSFLISPMTHFNKERFTQELLRYKDK